jgi:hypothetical protein
MFSASQKRRLSDDADALSSDAKRQRRELQQVPAWMRTVPLNLDDVAETHRHVTLNMLYDRAYWQNEWNTRDAKRVRDAEGYQNGDYETLRLGPHGTAWFPSSFWPIFYNHYALDVVRRDPLYYEQVIDSSRTFRLVFNLRWSYFPHVLPDGIVEADFYRESNAKRRRTQSFTNVKPNASLAACTKTLHEVVCAYFLPSDNLELAVAETISWTQSSIVHTDAGPRASGTSADHRAVVLAWNVTVSENEYLQITHSMLHRLRETYGARPLGHSTWNHVLNVRPFDTKRSVPLLFSCVSRLCPSCNFSGDDVAECAACKGSGNVVDAECLRLNLSAVRRCEKFVRNDKELARLRRNPGELVARCCFTAGTDEALSPNYAVPLLEPRFVPKSVHAKIRQMPLTTTD